MIDPIIYCDKCKSANTEVVCTDPKPKREELSMEEFVKRKGGLRVQYAVVVYSHWVVRCLKCGHEVAFTR